MKVTLTPGYRTAGNKLATSAFFARVTGSQFVVPHPARKYLLLLPQLICLLLMAGSYRKLGFDVLNDGKELLAIFVSFLVFFFGTRVHVLFTLIILLSAAFDVLIFNRHVHVAYEFGFPNSGLMITIQREGFLLLLFFVLLFRKTVAKSLRELFFVDGKK